MTQPTKPAAAVDQLVPLGGGDEEVRKEREGREGRGGEGPTVSLQTSLACAEDTKSSNVY